MDNGSNITLCFGVVDEVDIAAHFLEYHLELGVDKFIATDVGSTDGTLDILSNYERRGCLRLLRRRNPTDLVDWMSPMLELARGDNPYGWCLFCDVDEFWVLPETDCHHYFSAIGAPVVRLPRYNMVPQPGNEPNAVAPFTAFDLVVKRPLQFGYRIDAIDDPNHLRDLRGGYPPEILRAVAPKVAARLNVAVSVVPGFHDVITAGGPSNREPGTRGYVAHFPVRSAQQWRRKAELIAHFMEANPPHKNPYFGSHWVRLADIYRLGWIGDDFSRQVLSEEAVARYVGDGTIERDSTLARRFACILHRISSPLPSSPFPRVRRSILKTAGRSAAWLRRLCTDFSR